MATTRATLIDPGPIEFEATLQPSDGGGAACYVDFPSDLKATYGKGNLVPVRVLWDGRVEYRGSLARMGGACAMLLCRKDVVAALGKKAGDRVKVRVELDASPRVVELPEGAREAVAADQSAAAGWAALSPSCKREYVDWITEAKRPETREKRIAETVRRVAAGQRLRP